MRRSLRTLSIPTHSMATSMVAKDPDPPPEEDTSINNVDKPLQLFEMSDTGICSTCKRAGNDSELIECCNCKKIFHAVCSEGESICTKTFLKDFARATGRSNFQWVCNMCCTEMEVMKCSSLEIQVSSLMKIVKTLSDDIKELKSQVKPEKSVCMPASSEQERPSWSGVVKSSNTESSLLIKAKEGVAVDLNIVKEIVVSNSIPVKSTVVKENGDTYINFPSTGSREKITPLLKSSVIPETNIVTLKSKLPTIAISGIEGTLGKQDLLEQICKQNTDISALIAKGSTLEVVFIKDPDDRYRTSQAVARVSPNIRDAIKRHGNRLYIGLVACRVTDRFYVKRCNNCQQFGHYEVTCPKKPNMCCGYCRSGAHKSVNCPNKNEDHSNHSCSNCEALGKDFKGHSALYYNCPAYLAEQDKLKRSIGYNYNLN